MEEGRVTDREVLEAEGAGLVALNIGSLALPVIFKVFS